MQEAMERRETKEKNMTEDDLKWEQGKSVALILLLCSISTLLIYHFTKGNYFRPIHCKSPNKIFYY